MKPIILLCGAVVAVTLGSANADAGFRITSQYGGYGTQSGYGYGNQFNQRSYGYQQPNYGQQQNYGNQHRTYHDTSHYDYHPTTVTRHRNHLHVQRGHYDLHRSGHFDTHRH